MLSATTVPCGSSVLHETLNSVEPHRVQDSFVSFVSHNAVNIEVDEITITEEANEHVIPRTNDKSGRERVLGMTYVEAEFTLTIPNLDAAKFIDKMMYNDGQLDITIDGHTLSYDMAMLSEVTWWDDDMILSIRLEWACVGEAR